MIIYIGLLHPGKCEGKLTDSRWRLRRPRPLNSTQLKRRERDRKRNELPPTLTSVPDHREPRLINFKGKENAGRAIGSPRAGR
ncbi:hypothetical protein CO054_02250 [Candidatus Shapirobacteria bacterium CG_4_9_14_0_2_um_filter_39_11]|uniref:Uncharacterized protein n=1 Tax=Candidatus Shapirobacteria bacterium CG_4_9_14_0_2_um_filter_39_11 TaxID=1974478 RepID=A0A2M8ESF0_9BACT|nr:MAG: hypothetical protein CO054_02250 [Candidatus Shapirobacteria bacterium CG_4_9_14_0_2_um_filter_39_11]